MLNVPLYFALVAKFVFHPFCTFITQVDGTFVNALVPIDVTELGIVIEVREEQELKTSLAIEVTKSGMVIEIKEEQLQKAAYPIEVKYGGSDIEIKLESFLNVPELPNVPLGIEVIDVKDISTETNFSLL